MSQACEPTICVRVDLTNPGQFFACCGLLELADRLWDGAGGWFKDGMLFCISPLDPDTNVDSSLVGLLRVVAEAVLRQVDPDDDCSSPIEIPSPFGFRLDWWNDERSGGSRLKVWAGRMSGVRIARAMQSVVRQPDLQNDALFDYRAVVYDPLEPEKKVEPFYFDARRGSNALPLDIGFSPDRLHMKSEANPAVEFLCLIGLQRFRPMATQVPRVFDYYTWPFPLSACVAPLAVFGLLQQDRGRGFRFQNAFRTDQKKHKAFTTATPIRGGRP